MNINPLYFKQGIVTKQEFRFRKRPTPITRIELYADGKKLKIIENALTFQVEDSMFKMIFVEHGEFEMRSGTRKHKVTITKDFYIGEVLVTQKLWIAIMGSNPSLNSSNYNNPVERVTWYSCNEFIRKLNRKLSQKLSGKRFRLPIEKEWEFAAHGGNESKHFLYSGSDDIKEVAWCKSNSQNTTHEVAELKPNELGLFDMSGNVDEWCYDSMTCGYSSGHVVKGGAFNNSPANCKVESRNGCAYSRDSIGIRLCLS